ncbi:MAG: cbb3-type cytochrome oxidase assembly protein CcoS [Betaproteobacteria bacterium]
MNVILLLMLASLAVATVFLGGFIWAVRAGQFEDTGTPPLRMLAEDDPGPIDKSPLPETNQEN